MNAVLLLALPVERIAATPRIALVNVVITALGVPAWFAWRRLRPAENSR